MAQRTTTLGSTSPLAQAAGVPADSSGAPLASTQSTRSRLGLRLLLLQLLQGALLVFLRVNAAGVQVLHVVGPQGTATPEPSPALEPTATPASTASSAPFTFGTSAQ